MAKPDHDGRSTSTHVDSVESYSHGSIPTDVPVAAPPLLPRSGAGAPASRPPSRPGGPTRELSAGAAIGRYVVLYRLGRGGMGVVYAAYDPKLDRKIAIKVMRRRPDRDTERSQGRMLREAQALAKLSHPNVVAVHDTGLIGGQVFVAMDFVDGADLRQWLRAATRSRSEIVEKLTQAGEGLMAAHCAGIIHRDFKPDNVRVGVNGRVQVLDFGLARARPQTIEDGGFVGTRDPAEPRTTHDASAQLANRGRAAGTPAYMAPEQHRKETLDDKADQFAFCVTLYEALCGRLPFAGEGDALRDAIVNGKLREPPRHSPLPRPLKRLIWRGLSNDPAARYPSMKALLLALKRPQGKRRRVTVASVGLAGVVGIAATAWLSADAPADPCAGSDGRLAEVWDDEDQATVAEAFAAGGRNRSYAVVADRLDDYGGRWTQMHDDACRATHIRHEQSEAMLDLRMECLEGRRQALGALVQTLSTADTHAADRAPVAAASLPSLAACADAEALRERIALPSDRAKRTEIDELRQRLAHASALEQTGQTTDALRVLEPVVQRAEVLGWAPVAAQALHRYGSTLETVGRWDDAEQALTRAAMAAEVARDDRLLATVRTLLVLVVGDRGGRTAEGHLWSKLARAAIERQGGDIELQAKLETNLAFVLDREAKPEEVLQQHERALQLLTEAEAGPMRLAEAHGNLATSLAELGRRDDALRHAQTSRTLWLETLGPNHIYTATAVATLGYVLESNGKPKEAIEQYVESAATTERALGPDSPVLAQRLGNLAIARARSGDLDRAIVDFTRSLKIHEAAHGPEHVEVASAAYNLASALGMAGRRDEALLNHERALELRRAHYGPEHPQVAGSLDGVANQLEGLERPAEALPYREQALQIRERRYGTDHVELVIPLTNLAYNLLKVKRTERARTLVERALAIATTPRLRDDERAYPRSVLARVLVEEGTDPKRVARLVTEATAELGDTTSVATRRVLQETRDALEQR